MMSKKLINPKELYDCSGFGMSQAVIDTDSKLVFVSGQVDWDHHFQTSESTVEGQLKKALENLTIALEASGSSVDNVLKVTIYIRGEIAEQIEKLAPILAAYFGSSRPALTGLGVASLASPQTLVEVEAIAKAN